MAGMDGDSDDEADRDPCNLVTSPPSVFVAVVNTGRHDINGLLGIVVSFNLEHERYLVHMTKSQSTMALKKHHLKRASVLESYIAQAEQLRYDPRVREKMSKYLNLCQKFVAPLKLSHVIGVGSGLLFALVYTLGFLRTFIVTSFLGLVAGIAGQDLAGGPKKVVDNFPTRTKSLIEKQIPFLRGKVSNRGAIGVVIFLAIICAQSVFLTKAHQDWQQQSSAHRGSLFLQPAIDEALLEQYYSLGFEDAVKGRQHGASLARNQVDKDILEANSREQRDLAMEEEADNGEDTTIHRGKKRKSVFARLFSLPNIASMIYLYRSILELGTDRTHLFSIGQLAANFQHHVEWWRKLTLLLSAYNVIRIFV